MNLVLRWLRSVNPVGLGPLAVFQKEVRASGRRRLTYWSRGLYSLAFCSFIGLVFLIFLGERRSREGAARLEEMQQLAPIIGVTVMWFQFFGLMLAAPLLAGPCLCDERRNKTLPALLTTPLTAGEIVSGKLAGALVQLLVLAMVPFPVLLGMRVFGGLDAEVIFCGTLVALGAAVLAASWTISASLHARRGVTAAMHGWAMVVFLHGLIPVFAAAGGPWFVRWTGIAIPQWAFAAFSPPWALGLVSSELTGMGRVADLWTVTGTNLAGSLGVSALLWIWTASALRSVCAKTAGEFEGGRRRKKPARQSKSHAGPPGEPGGAIQVRPGTESPFHYSSRIVGDRPVLWRELRLSAFRSRSRLWVSIGGMVVILTIIFWSEGYLEETVHQVIAVIGAILFAVAASVATTGSLGSEREARTLPVLLTTPLTAGQIVWGKFLGGLVRLWPIPAALAVELLIVAPLGGCWRFLPPILYFGNLVCIAGILCAAGVFWSLVVRKTTIAGVVSLLVAGAVWFVIPMILTFFTELIGGWRGVDPGGYLISINPVGLAVGSALEIQSSGHGWSSTREFSVAGLHYTAAEFVYQCVVVWAVYGLGAFAILQITARLLNRRRDAMA